MGSWNRKRIAGWVVAITLSIWLPVAIDQAYFRYNAYILPICGLALALLLVALVLTTRKVSTKIRLFHHQFGFEKPLEYLLIVSMVGGAALATLAFGEWYAVLKSKEHIAELRKADAPKQVSSRPVDLPPTSFNPDASTETRILPKNSLVKARTQQQISKKGPFEISATREVTQQAAPVASVTNNAPGGIANSGSIGQATVNNYAPPSRTISTEERQQLINSLSAIRSEAYVTATATDNEAFNFAQELVDILIAANWTFPDNQSAVRLVMPQGKAPPGVRIGFHGEPVPSYPTRINVDETSLPGLVISALTKAHVKGLMVNRSPDIKEGRIDIWVLSNPDAK
jgi:hypothetical protein